MKNDKNPLVLLNPDPPPADGDVYNDIGNGVWIMDDGLDSCDLVYEYDVEPMHPGGGLMLWLHRWEKVYIVTTDKWGSSVLGIFDTDEQALSALESSHGPFDQSDDDDWYEEE